MKILIILAHPEIKSFNGTMFKVAVEQLKAKGHIVKTSNLYEMKFDAVSGRQNFTTINDANYFKQQQEEKFATQENGFVTEILNEQEKLQWCDMMIWQFPLWWFNTPAILKGWVDRVFAMEKIYKTDSLFKNGIFKGKTALLSLTTGAPSEVYIPGGYFGDIETILKPIQRGILEFTGFSILSPHIVYSPARLSSAEREKELENWMERLSQIATEKTIEVGSF